MHRPAITVEHIGAEGRPVVVIDGFAPDPERLVADAADLAYKPLGAFYPGGRAPVRPDYFDGLGPMLATIMREVFGAHERLNVDRALYSISSTPPAQLSLAQRIPHIDDVEDGRIAMVHYLTREDLGGTAFYRHRSTGFETVTTDRHRPYLEMLKADFARLGEPEPSYIDSDTPIFERIHLQAPAFNRAVIYPGNLLHCAALPNDRVLPSDPRKGRLTVAGFLTLR